MIDCNKTELFFTEAVRMCTSQTHCSRCPAYVDKKSCLLKLNVMHRCSSIGCVIDMVQKWSNENQPQTRLSEFLKNYPNAEIINGSPADICCSLLGISPDCCDEYGNHIESMPKTCKECWNMPIE